MASGPGLAASIQILHPRDTHQPHITRVDRQPAEVDGQVREHTPEPPRTPLVRALHPSPWPPATRPARRSR